MFELGQSLWRWVLTAEGLWVCEFDPLRILLQPHRPMAAHYRILVKRFSTDFDSCLERERKWWSFYLEIFKMECSDRIFLLVSNLYFQFNILSFSFKTCFSFTLLKFLDFFFVVWKSCFKHFIIFFTLVHRVLLKRFQKRRVSSPAPVTMASPSGDTAWWGPCERTRNLVETWNLKQSSRFGNCNCSYHFLLETTVTTVER